MTYGYNGVVHWVDRYGLSAGQLTADHLEGKVRTPQALHDQEYFWTTESSGAQYNDKMISNIFFKSIFRVL